MKIEVLKERETPLLSRKRVSLMAEYQGPTPSRMDFLKEVAKIVDVDSSLIMIKHIYTRFGKQKAKIIAHVYSDRKEMEKLEDEYLLVKHKKKEEEKKPEEKVANAAAKDTEAKVEAAEAPTAEKKEEPKEEKKEEPKPEAKEEKKEVKEEKPKEEAKPEEKPEEKGE